MGRRIKGEMVNFPKVAEQKCQQQPLGLFMFELTPGIGLSTTALQKYKLKTQENCCL
jgi:hypothetical protein